MNKKDTKQQNSAIWVFADYRNYFQNRVTLQLLAKANDLAPRIGAEVCAVVFGHETDEYVAEYIAHGAHRVLVVDDASLKQYSVEKYTALMETEGIKLSFSEDGVRRVAEIAFQVNEHTENIGARRLHTMMERLLESISFEASDRAGEDFVINAEYVDDTLKDVVGDEDLARYIL